MEQNKTPTLSDLLAMDIDRRWLRRHATERNKNNSRIIALNARRQRWNQQHPDQPPLSMISYTEHLCRQHGFDKATAALRRHHHQSQSATAQGIDQCHDRANSNVVPFSQRANA